MFVAENEMPSALRAARVAGQILLDMQKSICPREKAPSDLVTEADLAGQASIKSKLLGDFPDYGFVGEEDTESDRAARASADETRPCWVVDPLDGTANYVHGLDNYAVSIALRCGNQIVLGVVYDPVREQMFHAVRGSGAWLNEQRLQTSSVVELSQALVAASFAARVPPHSPEVTRFVQVLHKCQAIRRLGSAALNLCYVAAGKLDGYWATSVKTWDVAAGLLLVEEAGGLTTDLQGNAVTLDHPLLVAAATRPLHQELLATLGG